MDEPCEALPIAREFVVICQGRDDDTGHRPPRASLVGHIPYVATKVAGIRGTAKTVVVAVAVHQF